MRTSLAATQPPKSLGRKLTALPFVPFVTTAVAAVGECLVLSGSTPEWLLPGVLPNEPLVVIGGAFAVGWIASTVLMKKTTSRIERLRSEALSETEGALCDEQGGDEIACIGRRLNDIAVQLSEALRCEEIALQYGAHAREREEHARQTTSVLVQTNQNSLAHLMNDLPAGLLIVSQEGVIRFANASAANMIGKEPQGLLGAQCLDVLNASFRSARAFVETLLQTSRPYVLNLGSENNSRTIELRASELVSESQQAGDKSYLLSLVDCSESYRLEDVKQRLVAMIAHDLATPMASVNGTLEMAEAGMFGFLSPWITEELSKAKGDSAKLLDALKNIVSFQKVIGRTTSGGARGIHMQQLTREALKAADGELRQKRCNIVDGVAGELWASGDADKLVLLAARLLQMIAEWCAEETTIAIHAFKDGAFVCWALRIDSDKQLAQRLAVELEDSDISNLPAGGASANFRTVLWRLLLFQSGGSLSCTAHGEGCTVLLRLPAQTA